jgi:Rieske Fe-S protein
MTSRPTRTMCLIVAAVALGASVATRSAEIQQARPSPQQRVAALKQSMQESQTKLRQYEWTETTIISLKGEEKARTQKRCYYGADGKLQKVPIGSPAPPQQPEASGGRRGRVKAQIVENKKDDMKEYMERAAALVQQYVPPQPADIQRARDAGKVTANPAGPGLVRLEFPDYLKPGDRLSIDVDAAANQLRALTVASYLDQSKDAVVLAAQLGTLADGTSYTSQTTLDAAAKNIRVVIQNAGHRPLAR